MGAVRLRPRSIGRDLGLERDIDVLFVGAQDVPRRRRILRGCGARGSTVAGAGAWGEKGVWGEERTVAVNRTPIMLNLGRHPGELSGLRFLNGMATRSCVLSEPVWDPRPFVPGVHYAEAPVEELADDVGGLLADDAAADGDRRRRPPRSRSRSTTLDRRAGIAYGVAKRPARRGEPRDPLRRRRARMDLAPLITCGRRRRPGAEGLARVAPTRSAAASVRRSPSKRSTSSPRRACVGPEVRVVDATLVAVDARRGRARTRPGPLRPRRRERARPRAGALPAARGDGTTTRSGGWRIRSWATRSAGR